jgi:hypothetical protein
MGKLEELKNIKTAHVKLLPLKSKIYKAFLTKAG